MEKHHDFVCCFSLFMQHHVFNLINGTILSSDFSYKHCVSAYMWDVKSINTMLRSDAL